MTLRAHLRFDKLLLCGYRYVLNSDNLCCRAGKTAGIVCISRLPYNPVPCHNGAMERENNIPEGLDNTRNEAENTVVTPKTIDVFSDFAITLKEIHVRLIAEGYIVKDGVLTKSERLLSYEQDNKPPRKNR